MISSKQCEVSCVSCCVFNRRRAVLRNEWAVLIWQKWYHGLTEIRCEAAPGLWFDEWVKVSEVQTGEMGSIFLWVADESTDHLMVGDYRRLWTPETPVVSQVRCVPFKPSFPLDWVLVGIEFNVRQLCDSTGVGQRQSLTIKSFVFIGHKLLCSLSTANQINSSYH